MKFYYITFRSVTFAQRGEQILNKGGYHGTLLRTPKWMESQGCGYSVRVWTDDIQGAMGLLRRNKVNLRKLYIQKPDGTLEEFSL